MSPKEIADAYRRILKLNEETAEVLDRLEWRALKKLQRKEHER